MNFEDVVKNRFTTRSFSTKKISREILENILKLSSNAPSAKNKEPQVVYVVESGDGINKIDKATPCRYNAPTVLIICSDKTKAWKNNNYSTYEMDASIYATHIILSATNYGVDSVWVKMFDAEIIKKEFNLSDSVEPVCLIPIGYKSDDYEGSVNHGVRKEISEYVNYV